VKRSGFTYLEEGIVSVCDFAKETSRRDRSSFYVFRSRLYQAPLVIINVFTINQLLLSLALRLVASMSSLSMSIITSEFVSLGWPSDAQEICRWYQTTTSDSQSFVVFNMDNALLSCACDQQLLSFLDLDAIVLHHPQSSEVC